MFKIAARSCALLLSVALLAPTGVSAHDGHDHDALSTSAEPAASTAPTARAFPGAVLPEGFRDDVVVSGLDQPTAAEQADDGRFFVLEKTGRLLVLDDLDDPTPEVALEIRTEVHNYYDRGALGFTLDPDFATNGYVYLLYAYDHRLGDPKPAPLWGNPADPYYDECPQPTEGCVMSSRVVRYTITGSTAVSPKVLVEDWCQQFGSHSAGALEFDAEGYLYASGGEGANYDRTDWGQLGGNPCGDPTDEGGRLRAQDVRTTGDPTGLGGSVIRIDPRTGAGAPGNPLGDSPDANNRRLVAHGFRNPFRMALRPGTSDLYVGDVGEGKAEEVDHVGADRSVLPNFGWPCFEGRARYPFDKPLCTNLPAEQTREPYFEYSRDVDVVQGEDCKKGTASVSALDFVESPSFPADYRGALAFGDYARDCIWFMPARADGTPNSADPGLLVSGAGNPVDLFTGRGGELFYVDIGLDEQGNRAEGGGKLHRIAYEPGLPTARITSSAPYGLLPLDVDLDATTSSDPDGDELTYAWDLDGDGTVDSTSPTASFTYTEARDYDVRLTVTDPSGGSDTTSVRISAGNRPPRVRIAAPTYALRWSVDQEVPFSGSATDPDEGDLPGTALDWSLTMQHCPGDCHAHPISSWEDRDSDTFRTIDHELPSHLVLTATATDARGLTTSVSKSLYPREVVTTVSTRPAGLRFGVDGAERRTALSQRGIAGERVSLSARGPQTLDGRLWKFRSWSTGWGTSPTVTVPRADRASYVATFVPVKRAVKVGTSVAGLKVRVGGVLRRTTTFHYQVGSQPTLAAPARQQLDGRTYAFVRWSDGGRATHRFLVRDRDATVTAVYRRL
jgi:glucose/arabinose dehydrogenase